MEPDLGDIKRKIEEGRDFLDKIIQKIPGYKGYIEKSEMYDADRIIRNFMSDKLIVFKKSVDSVMTSALKGDLKNFLPELDSLNLVLERVLKKCKFADYGTTSSLSGAEVTIEDQDRILEYDWNLLQVLDEIAKEIEKMLPIETDKLSQMIDMIKKKIDGFEKSFDLRKSVILEVF